MSKLDEKSENDETLLLPRMVEILFTVYELTYSRYQVGKDLNDDVRRDLKEEDFFSVKISCQGKEKRTKSAISRKRLAVLWGEQGETISLHLSDDSFSSPRNFFQCMLLVEIYIGKNVIESFKYSLRNLEGGLKDVGRVETVDLGGIEGSFKFSIKVIGNIVPFALIQNQNNARSKVDEVFHATSSACFIGTDRISENSRCTPESLVSNAFHDPIAKSDFALKENFLNYRPIANFTEESRKTQLLVDKQNIMQLKHERARYIASKRTDKRVKHGPSGQSINVSLIKSKEEVIVIIQRMWRGKQARKYLRSMHRRAQLIQAFYRGYSVRKSTKCIKERIKKIEAIELNRLSRQRRIMRQKMELKLLSNTSAENILKIDKIRSHVCARTLQRWWRYHLMFSTQNSTKSKSKNLSQSIAQHLSSETNQNHKNQKNLNCSNMHKSNTLETNLKNLSYCIAKSKLERLKVDKSFRSNEISRPDMNEKNMQKIYESVLDYRSKVASLQHQRMLKKESLLENEARRKGSILKCKSLQQQLLNLPQLKETTEMSQNMYSEWLPNDKYSLKIAENRNENALKKRLEKKKWWCVCNDQDFTSISVDLRSDNMQSLSHDYIGENNSKYEDNSLKNVDENEVSLWWYNYASNGMSAESVQFGTNLHNWAVLGPSLRSRQASQLSEQRHRIIERRSEIIAWQVARLCNLKEGQRIKEVLFLEQSKAALIIQSWFRRILQRNRKNVFQIEKRIQKALQVLLNELSDPKICNISSANLIRQALKSHGSHSL